MRSAVRRRRSSGSSSVIDVKNNSVLIPQEKNGLVQSLTPAISGTIIAKVAWIISFFAVTAAGTGPFGVDFP